MSHQTRLESIDSVDVDAAVDALRQSLQRDPQEFSDLAQRVHRIEGCRVSGGVLEFALERHPDDWHEMHHYRFDILANRLSLIHEEVIDIFVTGVGLARRDAKRFFDEADGIDDFKDCHDDDEVRGKAESMAQGFLTSLADAWDYPDVVRSSPEAIVRKWDEIKHDAISCYVEEFADIAVDRWRSLFGRQ